MLFDLGWLIKEYKAMLTGVIHVGAHFGLEIAEYNKVASIQKIIMFEPDPDSFSELIKQQSEKTRCVNCALGRDEMRTLFYRSADNKGQSNSLLKPLYHLIQYPDIVFKDSMFVDLYELDSFNLGPVYNFINIDVQGYELEVFKGSKKTLEHVDYVMTEVNRAELYEGCCMVEQLDEFLGTFKFNRVETLWLGGTWGDAFYIKEK